MGDQITEELRDDLRFVPTAEARRVLDETDDPLLRARLLAAVARVNVLYMVARAGSGHLGSSFSSLDIVAWLHLHGLDEGNVYFSSKGHDVPGLYATLIALGRIPEEQLHRLRRLGGLPGHPDIETPGIAANTGSLGMGISKAKGMVLGRRSAGTAGRVFVMTGDGELQEGQIWESLGSAVTWAMDELTVIVDHNKLQSDTYIVDVSDLGDIEAKFQAFGWAVRRCDGHDLVALQKALVPEPGRPLVVVADTVKGRGVGFMEHEQLDRGALYQYHSGAPTAEEYARALAELVSAVDRQLGEIGAPPLRLAQPVPEAVASPATGDDLIAAYGEALVGAAESDERVVALDADLVKDVGLLAFRDRFPDRFVECGIAEQDMVSVAGGLAATGLVPFVHSFACFLSARPNEQIYNNASERRKVVYVGSLAGVLPAAPGHSHQAIRDVSVLRAVPGLVVVQPATASQVADAVAFSLASPESVYLRLSTFRATLPGELPADPLIRGRGSVVRSGLSGVVVAASSPVALRAAWEASELASYDVTLVHAPFLNVVDEAWLRSCLGDVDELVTVDDHLVDGGLGTTWGTAIAELGLGTRLHRVGVRGIPAPGRPDEVLKAERLDAAAIGRVLASLR